MTHHTRARCRVTLLCLSLLAIASSITAASVRGVQPSLASQYSTNAATFRCLDGSKSLKLDRVNDDYCDCVDGSDEPGLHQGVGCWMWLPTCAFTALFMQAHPRAATVNSIVATRVTNLCC